jgi:ABC-2 type transport system permease protein
MGKISLILKREYLTRVKKKSFLIMTIVGPILMAALIIVPVIMTKMEGEEMKVVAVVDKSYSFNKTIPETDFLKFAYLPAANLEDLKKNMSKSDYYAILFIPDNVLDSRVTQLYSNKQPSMSVKMHITNAIEKEIETMKLAASGIDKSVLESIKTNIDIQTIKWTEDGKEEQSNTELLMAVGFVSGFLIYFFIFMYGAQVMRGVIEEKTNRIVEVIISSVKPFQLMMGKIIGVAMVGLTQFLLWMILTFAIVTIAQTILFSDQIMATSQQMQASGMLSAGGIQQVAPIANEEMTDAASLFASLQSINFGLLIGSFLFFFIFGYLLYAALFAAIGSAVDNEADTQQFMMPVTIPLILSLVMVQTVIQNPEGPIAFWMSIIPFTSPIIMMVRIPFGVSAWEIALSMTLLVLTFIFTTWLAGKIYRTGILMYGKKVNYKELWKWLRYKS